ncbi:glycoside hydrolase family 43 protein [Nocardioides sp. WG-D5]
MRVDEDTCAQDVMLDDIHIRDPFLMASADREEYFLFGSTDDDVWSDRGVGFDCYRSNDIDRWRGPFPAFRPPAGFWADRHFWAPEVYQRGARFYMFASFKGAERRRGTQILVSDDPVGPYEPWSDGPVTPSDWDCLDGTLHLDAAGDPWIVFCHEWLQVTDGEILAQRLAPDLDRVVGEPQLLFRATDAPWVRPTRHPWMTGNAEGYVTDGPFLHRLRSGQLIMLWSSFGEDGYAMGVARSASGHVTGPWVHQPEPLWRRDGGHGMIVRALDGTLLLALHQPNVTPSERAKFCPLQETESTILIADDHSSAVHEESAPRMGATKGMTRYMVRAGLSSNDHQADWTGVYDPDPRRSAVPKAGGYAERDDARPGDSCGGGEEA